MEVLPIVVFLGLATFVRLPDTSMYDMRYALRIKRLRHFYIELAPEYSELLSTPIAEDLTALPAMLGGPFWRSLLSSAGIVEVVTSTLMGVFAGMAFTQQLCRPLTVSVGAVVFLLTLAGHLVYQVLRWQRARELK